MVPLQIRGGVGGGREEEGDQLQHLGQDRIEGPCQVQQSGGTWLSLGSMVVQMLSAQSAFLVSRSWRRVARDLGGFILWLSRRPQTSRYEGTNMKADES